MTTHPFSMTRPPRVGGLASTLESLSRGGFRVQLGGRRVLHPGRWLWLRTLAWFLLLFFLTAGAFGIPLQTAIDHLPAGNTAEQFTGVLLACMAALCCYALAVWLGEGRTPRELSLRPALGGLATGALLGLLMMSALMGVMIITGAYRLTLIGAAPAWTAMGAALQAAVTEELWMRALLFRLLWRVIGPVSALGIAAVIFAALHLANPGANLLAGATVTTAGLMFCALYALTGRLWIPIGLHLAWNLTQGYLFGAAVSGNQLGGSIALSTAQRDAPAWLTGGTFGPEASVFALLLIAAVTIATLSLIHKTKTGTSSQAPPDNSPASRPEHHHDDTQRMIREEESS